MTWEWYDERHDPYTPEETARIAAAAAKRDAAREQLATVEAYARQLARLGDVEITNDGTTLTVTPRTFDAERKAAELDGDGWADDGGYGTDADPAPAGDLWGRIDAALMSEAIEGGWVSPAEIARRAQDDPTYRRMPPGGYWEGQG